MSERAREAAFDAMYALGNANFQGNVCRDHSDAAIDAFLAALKADGYKLVRREATEEMLYEMGQAANFHLPRDANRALVWSAMWDAAPDLGLAVASALDKDKGNG